MVDLQRRHQLALRGERHLADALELSFAPLGDAELAFGDEERGLRRIAVDLPSAALVLAKLGVASDAAAAERDDLLLAQRPRGQLGALALDATLRRVAHTRDRCAAGDCDDALDRHLGARQGAGLVRGDDGGGAERLDRRQLLDDRVVPGHSLHAQREYDRQDRRQAFGHCRHGQRHAEQQHGNDVGGTADVRQQQDGDNHHVGNADNRQSQHAADASHLDLQRRRPRQGGVQQAGDAAHFRRHARGDDDGTSGASGHGGALEHHVEPIAQSGGRRRRRGVLEDGFALAGQGRLLNAQRRGLEEARVGTDRITLAQQEHVPAHQLGARHPHGLASAEHRRGHRRHLREGRDSASGLRLLGMTERRVQEDDDGDHDRVHRPAHPALDEPSNERDGDRDQQEVDEWIPELREETAPDRDCGCGAELVGATLCEATRRLLLSQTLLEARSRLGCERREVHDRPVDRHGVGVHADSANSYSSSPTAPRQ